MRLPVVEALFPTPWTSAARRMLPSPSPQVTATAMWGPILAWCMLQMLAEFVEPEQTAQAALDVFDRLRLREPLANSFEALGFEGEEAWRVAARIKVGLLIGAGVGREEPVVRPSAASVLPENQAQAGGSPLKEATVLKTEPQPPELHPEAQPAMEQEPALAAAPASGIPPSLWSDPDVRWLCGVHHAGGCEYLVRERYEELLWWLLMPSLLKLAAAPASDRAAVADLSREVDRALAAAEATGYRVEVLTGAATAGQPCEPSEDQKLAPNLPNPI